MATNPAMPQRLSQRIHALDLTRLLAMLMMIQGHTIYALGSPDVINIQEFPWNIWHFLRGFTAPVFLMVSGAAQVFANRRDEFGRIPEKTVRKRLKVALAIIGIGYLLVFPADRIYDLPFIEYTYWQNFFRVNVLQLIGVTLLMALAAFTLTRNDRQLLRVSLAAGIGIVFLSPFMQLIDWFAILPDFMAAYISYAQGSLFAIFPFAGYLFFGIALGVILKRMPQERRESFLFKWGIPIGLAFLALKWPVSAAYEAMIGNMMNQVDPGVSLMRVGAVFAGISMVTLLYRSTKSLTKYYTLFGRKALFIYVIHLIVIYGSPIFSSFNAFYAKSLGLWEVLLAAVFVEAVTLLITYLLDTSTRKLPKSKFLFRYSLTAYLIYVLFI